MTKVNYPEIASLDDRVQMLVNGSPPINIIKVMAHAQGNIESILRLSDSVLNRGELDPVLRQIALIRLCTVIGSNYERILLESVSRGIGIDQKTILAAREGSTSSYLSHHQQMAAKLAEELATAPKPTTETYYYFAKSLPVRQFVEIVQAIGFYLMQTRLIETFDISPEDDTVDLSEKRRSQDEEGLRAWREGRA